MVRDRLLLLVEFFALVLVSVLVPVLVLLGLAGFGRKAMPFAFRPWPPLLCRIIACTYSADSGDGNILSGLALPCLALPCLAPRREMKSTS